MAITHGVHHVGLTVPNIAETCAFFVEALGFETVAERPEYPAVFVSDGTTMVTLWQAEDPTTATPFDRKRCIGLHHLALRVQDGQSLDRLHRELEAHANVSIEFAPQPLGDGGARHMMLAAPGGIRVELIAVPS